jgi:hypothetical protein
MAMTEQKFVRVCLREAEHADQHVLRASAPFIGNFSRSPRLRRRTPHPSSCRGAVWRLLGNLLFAEIQGNCPFSLKTAVDLEA